MTIGEKIKQLRILRNITQEKLAEYLNITYQSVSKWEKGITLPDTAMLVPIANYFDVSLDELFCRDDDVKAADMTSYMARYREYANKGMVAEEVALWREASAKYPRDFGCLDHLANVLYLSNSSEGFTDEERSKNLREAISICERILEDCTDDNIRGSALQTLVLSYSRDGYDCADEKKAYEYATRAQTFYVSREMLLEHAYFNNAEGRKKARVHKHQNMISFMDEICSSLVYGFYGTADEYINACETAVKLWNTLIDDGNFLFYHCRLAMAHEYLAASYASCGERDKVIGNLKLALYHAAKFDERPDGEQHFTSRLVECATSDRGASSKNYTETDYEIISDHIKRKKCYDFLRDDSEFAALLM